MNHPTGRECNEGDCQWHQPKPGAPLATSDRKSEDYECIGKPHYWPECPRAIRAERDALVKAGDELATTSEAVKECLKANGFVDIGTAMRYNAALTAWKARAK